MSCVQVLLETNTAGNLQLVVQVAKEYTEQLGAGKIMELLESHKSYHGLYYYLGGHIAFSEDPEVRPHLLVGNLIVVWAVSCGPESSLGIEPVCPASMNVCMRETETHIPQCRKAHCTHAGDIHVPAHATCMLRVGCAVTVAMCQDMEVVCNLRWRGHFETCNYRMSAAGALQVHRGGSQDWAAEGGGAGNPRVHPLSARAHQAVPHGEQAARCPVSPCFTLPPYHAACSAT